MVEMDALILNSRCLGPEGLCKPGSGNITIIEIGFIGTEAYRIVKARKAQTIDKLTRAEQGDLGFQQIEII